MEDLLWTGLCLAWGPAHRLPVGSGGSWKDHREDRGGLRWMVLELSGLEDPNWVAGPGCQGGGDAGLPPSRLGAGLALSRAGGGDGAGQGGMLLNPGLDRLLTERLFFLPIPQSL